MKERTTLSSFEVQKASCKVRYFLLLELIAATGDGLGFVSYIGTNEVYLIGMVNYGFAMIGRINENLGDIIYH